MGKVMIINASPRASKSNSKQYAQLFSEYCRLDTEYCEVKKSNHLTLCQMIGNHSDIIFVFPLYADSIPVTLLNFLKVLEENAPIKKPTISVMINCGFIEPYQNDIAVKMLQLFARKNGYPFGFMEIHDFEMVVVLYHLMTILSHCYIHTFDITYFIMAKVS